MAQNPSGFTASNFSSGGGQARGQEQMGGSQVNSSEHLSTSLKLFSSLGLSPSDLDALAQIPEDQISVETLPHILRQLKNRKGRENFSDWEKPMDREAPRERDFSFRQESSQSHNLGLRYGASEDFSRHSDFGMAPSSDSAGYRQGRIGQPSQSKVEDFMGLNPARFPHVCSLCDFDVHSVLEWNQHINGLRHTENRRELLFLYPEWEPPRSSRSTNMDTPNLSAGILGPAPMSSQTSGMSSSWGGGAALSGMNLQGQNMAQRSRVVTVKYERKPLSNQSIFNFVEPFGRLREHLLLKNRGFLEMSTHDEALDVVNYYQQNPASLGGKPLVFQMSKRLFIEKQEPSNPADRSRDRPMERSMDRPMDRSMDRPMDRYMDRPMDRYMDRPMDRAMDRPMNRGLQEVNPGGSQVVYFSNLPREEEKKRDLLTIAGRFGTVEKHLFLQAEGFVQLASPRDAEMMVKYYSMNPLVVRGHQVRLNICTKYKTLNVRPPQGRRPDGNRGGARQSRFSPSPKRSTNRRSSPSPRRSTNRRSSLSPRRSSDRKSSSPKRSAAKTSPAPKTRTKEERKKEERPKSRQTSKAESKPEATSETKPESEQESKPESKADPQTESASDKDEPLSVKLVSESEGESETHKASNGGEHAEDTPEEAGEADELVDVESSLIEDNMADTKESVENTETDLHESEEDMENIQDMENMDDMVVLDELEDDDDEDESDDSKKGGMRVVVVVGLRKGYNMIKDLLQLAKPFGKVVRHLVLDMRDKAYLQFSTEEEAVGMAQFYNGNVQASICGRPVKIFHYRVHPTIQTGRVVYIGQIPCVKYQEEDILKFMEPFGKVTKFFLHQVRRECFIEMSKSEEAEEATQYYRQHPLMFHGKRLTLYVSRKYRQLRGRHVTKAGEKRVSKREKSPSPKPSDEPPAKKSREEETGAEERTEEATGEKEDGKRTEEEREEEEEGKEAAKGDKVKEEEDHEEQREETSEEDEKTERGEQEDLTEERELEDKLLADEDEEEDEEEEERLDQDSEHEQDEEEEMETSVDLLFPEAAPLEAETLLPSYSDAPSPESKPAAASLPLPPYDPDTPLGVEHVELGYYCHVCCFFCSSEDDAKHQHCSSKEHYNKLQKYLEKMKRAKKKTSY